MSYESDFLKEPDSSLTFSPEIEQTDEMFPLGEPAECGHTFVAPQKKKDSFSNFFAKKVSKIPLLTADEEKTLARKMLCGDMSAREQMITANIRLVSWVANRYAERGVPFEDLVQEGIIGLMRAVDGFDPERGFRFSTYAKWWVQQNIERAIDNLGRTIRLPVHILFKQRIRSHKEGGLCAKLGRTPTVQETADSLGIKDVEEFRKTSTLVWNSSALFLEELIVDDDGGGWDRIIGNNDHSSLEESSDIDANKETLRVLLETLKVKERLVIALRFGINSEEREYTLQEIGNLLGVTRERVRQIEITAIKKLRKKASWG